MCVVSGHISRPSKFKPSNLPSSFVESSAFFDWVGGSVTGKSGGRVSICFPIFFSSVSLVFVSLVSVSSREVGSGFLTAAASVSVFCERVVLVVGAGVVLVVVIAL